MVTLRGLSEFGTFHAEKEARIERKGEMSMTTDLSDDLAFSKGD